MMTPCATTDLAALEALARKDIRDCDIYAYWSALALKSLPIIRKLLVVLDAAGDFIAEAPHGDNCWLYGVGKWNIPDNRCHCGKDSMQETVDEALSIRRAIDCPDCEGTGRIEENEKFCLRCEGSGLLDPTEQPREYPRYMSPWREAQVAIAFGHAKPGDAITPELAHMLAEVMSDRAALKAALRP